MNRPWSRRDAPPALVARTAGARLILVVVAALLARAATFGNPVLGSDEEFYFTVSRMWAEGATPFVDVWDRKPIGLFLLYLPAAALPLPKERSVKNPSGWLRSHGNRIAARVGVVRRDALDACVYE